jgi:hypothetical protein
MTDAIPHALTTVVIVIGEEHRRRHTVRPKRLNANGARS